MLLHLHFRDQQRVIFFDAPPVFKEEEHPRKKSGQFAKKGEGEGAGVEAASAPSEQSELAKGSKIAPSFVTAMKDYGFKKQGTSKGGTHIYSDGKYEVRIWPPPGTGAPGGWTLRDDGGFAVDQGTSASQLSRALVQYAGKTEPVKSAEHQMGEIKQAALRAVKTLGYDPDRVKFVTEEHAFSLNGEKRLAAGTAHISGREKGTIKLYMQNLPYDFVAGVTSHEVMHQKYQTVIDAYEVEKKEIFANAHKAVVPGTDIKELLPYTYASDELRPEYAEKFPHYAALFPVLDAPGMRAKLRKSDGVTGYSEEWWKEEGNGKATTHLAIHETLAEMAYLRNKTGLTSGGTNWRNLYSTVNNLYKKHHWGGKTDPGGLKAAAANMPPFMPTTAESDETPAPAQTHEPTQQSPASPSTTVPGDKVTMYRAGGPKARYSEGTFYSAHPKGAEPYGEPEEYQVTMPEHTFNAKLGGDYKLYKEFLEETGHPAGRGRNALPFWTVETELRNWLKKKDIDPDAIWFDENTGHPSLAVYRESKAE